MIDIKIYKTKLRPKKKGQWNMIKGESGCYIFTNKNNIIYVGRSQNLYTRLISHYSKGGICNAFPWDTIHIVFCEDHRQMEKYLIEKLKPKKNGSVTSGFYYL